MGGRGSSGSGGGGGGGSALSAKMPTLTGSTKQVAWAEEIRHEILANTDHLVKAVNDEFGLYAGFSRVSGKVADYVKNDIISALQNVTSASQIIDKRHHLTANRIRQMMIDAQLAVERGDLKL